MSKQETFEERYKSGVTPWELDRPDNNLVNLIKEENIPPCKALEIGCGTGSNAIWLAQNGFDVKGLDFSNLAIQKAEEKTLESNVKIEYASGDFLNDTHGDASYGFSFDRGCFHSFDDEKDRAVFASNVAKYLTNDGLWFSILGNADAEPRDDGPPVRTAMNIVAAVEPFFEVLSLNSGKFDSNREKPFRCWFCLMRKRMV